MSLSLLGAFAAAVLYGAGTVLQAVGLRRAAGADARTLWQRVWAGRLYVVGLVLDGLGFLASVAALRSLPLFVVESAIASSVAVTALLATLFLGTRLARSEVVALAAVALGLVGLAASAQEGPGVTLGQAGTVLLLATLVPVALVGLAGARLAPRAGVPLLAVAAGLGFGGTGVAARVLTVSVPWWRETLDPVMWALLGYSALALVAYGLGLQRGSVTSVAAITFTVETVVPAVVGLVWLGDRVRPGLAAVTATSFLLTLGGCLRLAGRAAVAPEPVP